MSVGPLLPVVFHGKIMEQFRPLLGPSNGLIIHGQVYAVARLSFSFCSVELMLGVGQGLSTICSLSSFKSAVFRTPGMSSLGL